MALFSRLKTASKDVWSAYTEHDFVKGIQAGTLPEAAFSYYLKQDYLFLIHFARAYALAAYKSDNLADLRAAADTVTGLINVEMKLHVDYCKSWGLSEEDMQGEEEAPENMAYTRYVLEKGHAGDVLDLYVALAPCVVGYGEIGSRLINSPDTIKEDNPYLPWIEMYASDDYKQVAQGAIEQLDVLAKTRFTEARFGSLSKTFHEATRLEVGFWQMGLDALGRAKDESAGKK